MLSGKTVVVGVCGGIAAYKICELVSRLKKANADVYVVMTEHATQFVAPLTFETLSGNRVVCDMFDRDFPWEVEHISLAKKADIFVIAPATANVIAKAAHGIADDFLTTTLLAATCKVLVVPAMNTNMLNAEATRENLKTLGSRGVYIMESESGRLACGDCGSGRLPEPNAIFDKTKELLLSANDFAGKTVLVTAGGTEEPIDPVRVITNRSSGKMGMALCSAVKKRGGRVVLVCANTLVEPRDYDELIKVKTTREMYDVVLSAMDNCDIIIKAAAPADYYVERAPQKIKSESLSLNLKKNPDIASAVGEKKGDKKLVIFCAETENLKENARKKLAVKRADMVVANDVCKEGAGFDVDTNVATIITDSVEKDLPVMLKSELADIILDEILKL